MQIVARSGLSWSAVKKAIKLYEARGDAGLEPGRRGKKQAVGRLLTEAQERSVRQAIGKKQPWSYSIDAHLWSRKAVAELIEKEYGVTLTERGLGNYLGRWGLKLDNARSQPNERCSRKIGKWLGLHFREVVQQARADGAEIYWMNKPVDLDTDQWAPDNDSNSPSPESPCANEHGSVDIDECLNGDMPEPEAGKKCQFGEKASSGISKQSRMISVVSSQGKLLWEICHGRSNYAAMMKFLRALIKDSRSRTLILILYDDRYYRNQKADDLVVYSRKTLRIYPGR